MDLNLLHFHFFPWKYPSNWGRNLKHFFRTFKWAWQRITRGFCDSDAYDLDHYYSVLLRDTLNHLADHTHGHPSEYTEDGWLEHLREIATLLDKSIDRTFEDFQYYTNPYEDEYSKHLELVDFTKLAESFDAELADKYYSEDKKIYELRRADLKMALDKLYESWGDLWD